MNEREFLKFTDHVDWRFAKSVPNWPHFYIVENELTDQEAYRAARSFIQESGRDGKFYDLDVRYHDADGWTYWSSPLIKPFESQYMLNRCKTEFTYESLAESGALPPEGFQGAVLDLNPVLKDPEFQSLVRDAKEGDIKGLDIPRAVDHEHPLRDALAGLPERRRSLLRRHPKTLHSLSYMLEDGSVKGQCDAVEFELLESIVSA